MKQTAAVWFLLILGSCMVQISEWRRAEFDACVQETGRVAWCRELR